MQNLPGHLVNKIHTYEKASRNVILTFEENKDFYTICTTITLLIKLPCGVTIMNKSKINNYRNIIRQIVSDNYIDTSLPHRIHGNKHQQYLQILQLKRDQILSYIKTHDKFKLEWSKCRNRSNNIVYCSGKLKIFIRNMYLANIPCTKYVFITAINDYVTNKIDEIKKEMDKELI